MKGSLVRVKDTFVCKTCERAGDEEDRNVEESLDLGNGLHRENVGKFCYLGDMLNGGRGANPASVARVRCAWRTFKELSGILTRKEVSLKLMGKLYVTCVRNAMVYGSATWAMMAEQSGDWNVWMVRWMCGVSLKDRVPSAELKVRMEIESVCDAMKRNRLRWLGHVLRRDDDDWVKKIMSFEVEGKRGRGRPRITWSQAAERNMRECGLKREDAKDKERWRRLLCRADSQPLVSRENGRKTTVVCNLSCSFMPTFNSFTPHICFFSSHLPWFQVSLFKIFHIECRAWSTTLFVIHQKIINAQAESTISQYYLAVTTFISYWFVQGIQNHQMFYLCMF